MSTTLLKGRTMRQVIRFIALCVVIVSIMGTQAFSVRGQAPCQLESADCQLLSEADANIPETRSFNYEINLDYHGVQGAASDVKGTFKAAGVFGFDADAGSEPSAIGKTIVFSMDAEGTTIEKGSTHGETR
jgi:hypothetical protein